MMNIFIRFLVTILVFFAAYIYLYWMSFSSVSESDLIVNALSIISAIGICSFVWIRLKAQNKGPLSYIILGAALIGAVSFLGGFFGPMIFTPNANLGPLLGLFTTGPIGFLFGGVAGLVYWYLRHRKEIIKFE